MKKLSAIFSLFLFGLLPINASAHTNVQVSTSNSGGINSEVRSTAGSNATATATTYTKNSVGNEGGKVQVRINTIIDGVEQTKIITETTQSTENSGINVYIATTSESVAVVSSSIDKEPILSVTATTVPTISGWLGKFLPTVY